MNDWISLWSELVDLRNCSHQSTEPLDDEDDDDPWGTRAAEYDAHTRTRWTKSDSSRTLITAALDASSGATLLDIGAGTGKWVVMLASHVRRITAVEPSTAMIGYLRTNLANEQITNVEIIQDSWPSARVAAHDFTLCSHAMYGINDFPSFIRSLQAVTRQTCFLLMRAPTVDSVVAEAAHRVLGHTHDSPNYQVALNILWEMGIHANVVMQDSGLWDPWVNDSLLEAFNRLKRHLGLDQPGPHDEFLMHLLQRRLTLVDGKYVWPRAYRTALLYWKPSDYAAAPHALPSGHDESEGSRP